MTETQYLIWFIGQAVVTIVILVVAPSVPPTSCLAGALVGASARSSPRLRTPLRRSDPARSPVHGSTGASDDDAYRAGSRPLRLRAPCGPRGGPLHVPLAGTGDEQNTSIRADEASSAERRKWKT